LDFFFKKNLRKHVYALAVATVATSPISPPNDRTLTSSLPLHFFFFFFPCAAAVVPRFPSRKKLLGICGIYKCGEVLVTMLHKRIVISAGHGFERQIIGNPGALSNVEFDSVGFPPEAERDVIDVYARVAKGNRGKYT